MLVKGPKIASILLTEQEQITIVVNYRQHTKQELQF